VSRNLVSLVDIRCSEITFTGSQVVTHEPSETLLYIIESSVGFELRITFRHRKVELILYVGVLRFQSVCAEFGSSRNTPRLLMCVAQHIPSEKRSEFNS